MASDLEFVEYVCDQAKKSVRLTFRKMFGEYVLYANGKVVALICDNSLFLKPTPAAREFLGNPTEKAPYPGAKPYFLIDEDLDNRDRLGELFLIIERSLPAPKPKKRG